DLTPTTLLLPTPRAPLATLLPYTTLFRSGDIDQDRTRQAVGHQLVTGVVEPSQEPRLCTWALDLHRVPRDSIFENEIRVLADVRSEEHTSELQSRFELVCRLLLEKKK